MAEDKTRNYEKRMGTTMASNTAGKGEPVDENRAHPSRQKSFSNYNSQGGDKEKMKGLQRQATTAALITRAGRNRIGIHEKIFATTSRPTFVSFTTFPAGKVIDKGRNPGKRENTGVGNGTTISSGSNYDNPARAALGGEDNWKGSSLRWTRHFFAATPATARFSLTASAATTTINREISKNNIEQQEKPSLQQQPLLARSIRTTVTASGGEDVGELLRSKRRMDSSSSGRQSSSLLTAKEELSGASSGTRRKLMMSAAPGIGGPNSARSNGEISSSTGMLSSSPALIPNNRDNNNYIVGGDDVVEAGVSMRLLDIHQISSRLHRSFPWEGLGLHHNATIRPGSIGQSITDRIGFNPATTPHTLIFSSLYIVPLILLFGLVVGLIWLFCACTYHTMKRIKFALCPSRTRGGSSKKGKSKNNTTSSNTPCSIEDGNKKPEILTPEILEMRRQERLAFLQAECANLEQQLTGLRLASPQSTCEEKSTTLTSRASDSDLEYLGASESPPLKRNSISLQDIPQSVIRIRREKELRQIKEEIEYLRTIAQQEKEKAAQVAKALKGSLLITHEFELPGSKPGSPSDAKVEPLSQHISHLKTQRKLNEIRTELEDLAMQLLHADEIKAKRSSLQELPRTALNIQREHNIIKMTNEIQKFTNYKMQKKNVIETVLEQSSGSSKGAGATEKQTGSKSFNSKSPSPPQDVAAKYSDPDFVRGASIRRQREQELNRVRVELKDLAYKLNLNPMNYISEDRMRLVPSQSMQSTSSVTGHLSYNKSTSSSSALNHV